MIAILLTTYNGERYLGEQLNSIIAQTYQDWCVLIHDDCSSDTTLDMVRSYAAKDSRIKLLETGVKRGPMDGFMWLLEHADADYYMFCDQDDVWKSDKIEKTLQTMTDTEIENPLLPVVVGTDLSIVDESLNIIYYSYRSHTNYTLKQLSDKKWHLFYDDIQGCTMMLNRKAKEVAFPYHEKAVMHDWWIMVSVLWKGGVVGYYDAPTMLYRQHMGNHTGVRKIRPILSKFWYLSEIKDKTSRQYISTKCFHQKGICWFVLTKTIYMIRVQWQIRVLPLFKKKTLVR